MNSTYNPINNKKNSYKQKQMFVSSSNDSYQKKYTEGQKLAFMMQLVLTLHSDYSQHLIYWHVKITPSVVFPFLI